MARRNTATARKAHGPCRSCGQPITPGQVYHYWRFRFRRPLKVHEGCPVQRSWLTGSEILGTIWDLVDNYAAEGDTPEEVAASLRDFSEQFRGDVVEGLFQEKLSNMEGAGTGLENTPVYEELQERMYELESYCDNMDAEADDIESAEP